MCLNKKAALFVAIAIGASAAGWQPIKLNQKSSVVKISETINALVVQNDSLFAATSDGVWASPSGLGGDWVAYGLQGQNVRLLNFKVKRLAIVATTGNFQPLFELIGGVWTQNTALPNNVAITGGVNFEQMTNADLTHSIVIPTGKTTSGDIYSSQDGGATFTKITVGKVATGVNTFDGDPNFYFPNSYKVVGDPEANNNQTSFFWSLDKGLTFARIPVSYSIATGIPANFIFKLASTTNPGHTYHFLGGQKDVVRVDSLGITSGGPVISWNNPANMKCFSTIRTFPITDGPNTNLTSFPTYKFKKMLAFNSSLYLLAEKAIYLSKDEGATYTSALTVVGDTILTSVVANATNLIIGTNKGIYSLAIDNTPTSITKQAEASNLKVYTNSEGINVRAEGNYNVTIYNVTGKIISSVKNRQGAITIPVSVKQTIYLVKVDTEKRSDVVKVTITE